MSLAFYKVIHILGLLLVFTGLGGITLQAYLGGGNGEGRRLTRIAHGVGLLLMLVAGFGALARLGMGFPGWVWLKIVIWIVIAGITVVIRRQPQLAGFLWFALPVLGAFAGYLALYKPF